MILRRRCFYSDREREATIRNDSDWDIVILIDDPEVTNEIEDKFRDQLYEIELESGQIISTFIYPKEVWRTSLKYSPLYKNVHKEGVLL